MKYFVHPNLRDGLPRNTPANISDKPRKGGVRATRCRWELSGFNRFCAGCPMILVIGAAQ
jgi:hypothetical protein